MMAIMRHHGLGILLPVSLYISCLFAGHASWNCGYLQYWSNASDSCVNCTVQCSEDSIVRRLCQHDTDTVCGPSAEFHWFDGVRPVSSGRNVTGRFPGLRAGHASQVLVVKDGADVGGLIPEDGVSGVNWKAVNYFLIIFVCSLAVLCVVLFVAYRHVARRVAATKRSLADGCYPALQTVRPSFSVSRLLDTVDRRPPSPGQPPTGPVNRHTQLLMRLALAYCPKRRLLSCDTDDVFDSEDSAGGSQRLEPVPSPPVTEPRSTDHCDPCLCDDVRTIEIIVVGNTPVVDGVVDSKATVDAEDVQAVGVEGDASFSRPILTSGSLVDILGAS